MRVGSQGQEPRPYSAARCQPPDRTGHAALGPGRQLLAGPACPYPLPQAGNTGHTQVTMPFSQGPGGHQGDQLPSGPEPWGGGHQASQQVGRFSVPPEGSVTERLGEPLATRPLWDPTSPATGKVTWEVISSRPS